MKKTKEQKGITLIALIITIVVLLILAVVAIRAVQGDGILSYAKNARDDYGAAQDKEEEMLQNYLDILKDNNPNGSNNENNDDEQGESNSVFDAITAENYGDTITYSAGGVDEWKVFYKDDTHLYIITSDYLLNSNIPDKFVGKMDTAYGKYNAYWEAFSNVTDDKAVIRSEVANKWGLSWFANNGASLGNNNIKAVADLLDEEAWTSKFGNEEKGIKAIGAPTLEMWVKSWNEKGTAVGTEKYVPLKTESNETGYFVGPTTTESLSGVADDYDDSLGGYTYNIGTSTDGYKDSMYFPYTSNVDDCWGYWLSSPSAGDAENIASGNLSTDGVMVAGYSGVLNFITYNYDAQYAVRPVVSLSSNFITTNTDGRLSVAQ